MSVVKALIALVERPGAVQSYRDFAKALEEAHRPLDANAVTHLVEVRFPRAQHPHPDAEQR